MFVLRNVLAVSFLMQIIYYMFILEISTCSHLHFRLVSQCAKIISCELNNMLSVAANELQLKRTEGREGHKERSTRRQ